MNKNALEYKYIAKTNVFAHLTFVETIGITGGGGHSGEFIQLNAEGARRKPNLSGKQTEQIDFIPIVSVFCFFLAVRQASGSYFFGGIIKCRQFKTHSCP